MQIHIAAGVGSAPTKLAAFDTALVNAGIANYNLIKLSSVIPEHTQIVVHKGKIRKNPGKWGDRLYTVMAEERADTPNVEAWAGIGWVQTKTGAGLFVEHEGASKTAVEQDIRDSLEALMKNRKMNPADFKIHMKIAGITRKRNPVCALVVAVYQASDWENTAFLNQA